MANVCNCLQEAVVYFGGDADALAGAVHTEIETRSAAQDETQDKTPLAAATEASGGKGGKKKVHFDDGEDRSTALAASSGSSPEDRRAALEKLTTSVSECSEATGTQPGEPCSSKKVLNAIKAFRKLLAHKRARDQARAEKAAKAPALPTNSTPGAQAVRKVAEALGCTSESCVVSHPDFKRFAVSEGHVENHDVLEAGLAARFKPKGPRDSTALLNNFNIDAVLQDWAVTHEKFFNFPFAMIDFESTGHALARVDPSDILEGRVPQHLGKLRGETRRPCDTFACVLNTDVSTGRGKHWVAVFGDCRGRGTWSVEYFNSAGNPPPPAVARWLEETAASLRNFRVDRGERFGEGEVKSVPLTDVRHQESATECGLYALYFIRRRLEGAPVSEFRGRLIPDEAMTEFRAHVFRGD